MSLVSRMTEHGGLPSLYTYLSMDPWVFYRMPNAANQPATQITYILALRPIEAMRVLRGEPYPAYSKIDQDFFEAYKLREKDEYVGYMFRTKYPVKDLGNSILAYRRTAQKDVDAYKDDGLLLLRDGHLLVFGVPNACVLLSSDQTHHSLNDALSSHL